MLIRGIYLLLLATSALCQSSSSTSAPHQTSGTLSVLIRTVDIPQQTNYDGSSCTDFAFINAPCQFYLYAGIAIGEEITPSSCEKVVPGLVNMELRTSSETAFKGFQMKIKIASTVDCLTIVDQYTLNFNTTELQGVSSYVSTRPDQLPTTLSFVWTTNNLQPVTTVGPSTTAVSATSPVSEASTTAYTGTTPVPTTTPKLPTSCDDISATTSGKYNIYINGSAVTVYCDFTEHGAYTVIQSRGDADNLSFNKTYEAYQSQFGTAGASTNFWLGLDNMNALTTSGNYGLEISLCCKKSITKLLYHNFKIGDKDSGYVLQTTADLGNTGLNFASSLGGSKDIGSKFHTPDNYAGSLDKELCAELQYEDVSGNQLGVPSGGWWYGSCANNLNGEYIASTTLDSSCKLTDAQVGSFGALGIGMRTTTGAVGDGWDVDLRTFDRVRMAVYSFDSSLIDQTDASFCQ